MAGADEINSIDKINKKYYPYLMTNHIFLALLPVLLCFVSIFIWSYCCRDIFIAGCKFKKGYGIISFINYAYFTWTFLMICNFVYALFN